MLKGYLIFLYDFNNDSHIIIIDFFLKKLIFLHVIYQKISFKRK
jgi:hypothetical protein